ncbi:MAG: MFS transporter [Alphaproteobacteria bacterium]
MRPAALTILCCTFLVLNLLAFMTVAAVLPTLIAEWNMSNTQAGWLGGIYFAGYMVAVPFLLPLTDRIPPKAVSLGGGIVGAASALSFALLADGFWSGLILRLFGGVAMAGAYMPTLKIIADSLNEPWRSRASSYYTSVFAIGTAFSILAGGAIADTFGWRWSFAAAGLGNLVALGIGSVWLPTGSCNPSAKRRLVVDFRPVFRNRAAMGYVLAYAGHLWEGFTNRIWIVAFLAWVVMRAPGQDMFATPVVVATLVAICGVPVSMIAGEWAAKGDRNRVLCRIYGVTLIAGLMLVLTAVAEVPPGIVAIIAILYGMAHYADTGTVTAGTVSVADPELRGATMAVHAMLGFVGATLGPAIAGVILDVAGGREEPGAWALAWLVGLAGGVFAALSLKIVGRPVSKPA